jgi:hypothetical protein
MAINIAAEGFPHFALWSRPDAPFVSVETWSGHGDPEGFDGDLYDKPSMIHLQPQQRSRHSATFAFSAALSG